MRFSRHQPLLLYSAFALLSLSLLALHSYHFRDYNYRQDEAWIVFFALQNTARENLLSLFIRNLTTFATEFYMIEFWVGLFGSAEPITRYMATLFTALTFAFIWRLASDLFDRRTAFGAVFIFGTLAFVQFFSHEIRPYPALLTGTAAVMLFFVRWLRHRTRQYAFLYVLAIVLTVYVHPFIVYTVLGQAIFFVLFVRWDARFYIQTGALFVASALLSFVRLYATVAANAPGGQLGYGLRQEWESLRILYEQMSIRPEAIFQVLFIAALLTPVSALFPQTRTLARPIFRFGAEWRKWYLFVVPAAILILSFWVNERTRSVTPRNLIVLIPPLAIWAAFALRTLPRSAAIAIALVIAIPAVQGYRPFVANGPYREMAQTIKTTHTAEDKIIVAADWMWQHVAMTYYLRYQLGDPLPNENLFHWMPLNQEWNLFTFPDKPIHLAMRGDEDDQSAFINYIGNARTVWLARGADYTQTYAFAEPMRAWLLSHYVEHKQWSWEIPDFYAEHSVIEYRRIPDTLDELFVFDQGLSLQSWALLPDDVRVTPCQTIAVESWWQTNRRQPTNDNVTLVLTTTDGENIAQNDGPPADTLLQLWRPNRLYVDARQLTIPCDTPAGEYVLLIGVYNYETLASRPIKTKDGADIGTRAYLTTLFVSE